MKSCIKVTEGSAKRRLLLHSIEFAIRCQRAACPTCFTKWFVSRLPFDPAAGVRRQARASQVIAVQIRQRRANPHRDSLAAEACPERSEG
jgi:hypothetical protein